MYSRNSLILIFMVSSLFCNSFDDLVEISVSANSTYYHSEEIIGLTYDLSIKDDYHIYSVYQYGETYVDYIDSVLIKHAFHFEEPVPVEKFDKNFNQITSYHKGEFALHQNLQLNKNLPISNYDLKGTLIATACNPSQCVRIYEDFIIDIEIRDGEPREQFLTCSNSTNNDSSDDFKKETQKGIIPFIIFSLGMGFLALLTPCVFPMIPITVSYFTKLGEKDNTKPFISASIYALGIIVIFSLLGLLLAMTLGASGAQQIAQNPWINLFIGALFIFFAFSLFGYYELQAPQFLQKYSLKQESKGGIIGILFMSLTFTLASFTCTVAFVGSLLVVASQGQYFWPIIGMLSFATAFASPFFLLALFPQYLSRLPQSGGWLNSVKVTMGFLEIAAAFKFISNTDLVWEWQIFTREIVLFIWILIILLIGLYFIGLIKFPHDSKSIKISNNRKISFIFIVLICSYLSTGLFNKKIYQTNNKYLNIFPGLVEAYLPPPSIDSNWIEDLDQSYNLAEEYNKPIFLDFTGYTCTNCRWMEINVFEDPEVKKLFERFVLVKLYTDGREKKHKEYQQMEIDRFGTAALPFYVVLNANDEFISSFPGYTTNIEEFKSFLKDSISKFENQK